MWRSLAGAKRKNYFAGIAYEVGRELARRGAVLICGGLGGVMQAAAQGAQEAGGITIGILPGPDRRAANPFLTYSLVTNLGHARNMVIAHSAEGLIAVEEVTEPFRRRLLVLNWGNRWWGC